MVCYPATAYYRHVHVCFYGGIAGIPTDGLPQPLFYMAGLLCWNYFSECLSRCSDTFNANQNVFGKVYFPRLVVPCPSLYLA